jgi:hypothetical protein
MRDEIGGRSVEVLRDGCREQRLSRLLLYQRMLRNKIHFNTSPIRKLPAMTASTANHCWASADKFEKSIVVFYKKGGIGRMFDGGKR